MAGVGRKARGKSFSVDPVALHIHERVSTQAILKVAAREDVNRSLFADPDSTVFPRVSFRERFRAPCHDSKSNIPWNCVGG